MIVSYIREHKANLPFGLGSVQRSSPEDVEMATVSDHEDTYEVKGKGKERAQ